MCRVKSKTNILQTSTFPLVLHPEPLVRAIGQVEFSRCFQSKSFSVLDRVT